ncbi:unnamed protein product, partial [Onchocerca ochengi]|uniref:BLVR domain-containing protein n=1 Tax=Onchocerca ochengi TaxID=42157 RepID=A0A182EBI4_ONCOC
MAENDEEEIELSDVEFEDEEEEMECELVSEPAKKLEPRSTPNTVSDNIATVPDIEHDIKSKQPEKQKTKRPAELEEPQKVSSPTVKKPKPEKGSTTSPISESNLKRPENNPKSPAIKKPVTSEKPSIVKKPMKIKPTEDGRESQADITLPVPKAKKPSTESKKPDAKPQKKPKEPDDEE